MDQTHRIIRALLPTDQGKFIEAWQIVGTNVAYAGQEGEQLAREHATALDEEAAMKRRREREGD